MGMACPGTFSMSVSTAGSSQVTTGELIMVLLPYHESPLAFPICPNPHTPSLNRHGALLSLVGGKSQVAA